MNFAPILKLAAPLAGMVTTIIIDAAIDKAATKVMAPETKDRMTSRFAIGLVGAVVGGIASAVVVKTIEHVIDKKFGKEEEVAPAVRSGVTYDEAVEYLSDDANWSKAQPNLGETVTYGAPASLKRESKYDFSFDTGKTGVKKIVASNYDEACELFTYQSGLNANGFPCSISPHIKNAFGI